MENFRRYRKLDRIAITKILKSFSTNGCRKWKNKKFVVLAEYFEQQTDFSSYRIKIRQSRRSLLRRNQSYLQIFSLPRKWKPYHGAIRKFPRNLRTALERYFRFHLNYKRLRVEVKFFIKFVRMWNEKCSLLFKRFFFKVFTKTYNCD